MSYKLKNILVVLGLGSTLAITGCSEQQAVVDNNKITIGVMAGAEEQVAEIAAKEAKDKYGLEVKLITFSDYITPMRHWMKVRLILMHFSINLILSNKLRIATISLLLLETRLYTQLRVTQAKLLHLNS